MGWGLAVTGNSSAVAAAVAPLKRLFFGKRFPSRKDQIREISARYYRHSDRTDAAVLFSDSEKSETPKTSPKKSVAGTFLGLKKTHMLETPCARNSFLLLTHGIGPAWPGKMPLGPSKSLAPGGRGETSAAWANNCAQFAGAKGHFSCPGVPWPMSQ